MRRRKMVFFSQLLTALTPICLRKSIVLRRRQLCLVSRYICLKGSPKAPKESLASSLNHRFPSSYYICWLVSPTTHSVSLCHLPTSFAYPLLITHVGWDL